MNIDKIEKIINNIKTYNMITDLDVSYNIDTKSFLVFDSEKRLIGGAIFDINEFTEFIKKLSKLSLWNSDYEMEFKVMKY